MYMYRTIEIQFIIRRSNWVKKVWNSIKHLHVHSNAHEVHIHTRSYWHFVSEIPNDWSSWISNDITIYLYQKLTNIWYPRYLMIDLHGYKWYYNIYLYQKLTNIWYLRYLMIDLHGYKWYWLSVEWSNHSNDVYLNTRILIIKNVFQKRYLL